MSDPENETSITEGCIGGSGCVMFVGVLGYIGYLGSEVVIRQEMTSEQAVVRLLPVLVVAILIAAATSKKGE